MIFAVFEEKPMKGSYRFRLSLCFTRLSAAVFRVFEGFVVFQISTGSGFVH
jgi:hypothetical protein